MIDAGELRRGNILRLDGKLYQVVSFQHLKLGRGSAQVKIKLRDLVTKSTVERGFQASQKYERVRLDTHNVQYLFNDPAGYHFMDMETFDELLIAADDVGDTAGFLSDGLELQIVAFEGRPVGVELPVTVDLEVKSTEPAIRGDTANAPLKSATLATGVQIQVPLFVEAGDIVRVDTRTGAYQTRVT